MVGERGERNGGREEGGREKEGEGEGEGGGKLFVGGTWESLDNDLMDD